MKSIKWALSSINIWTASNYFLLQAYASGDESEEYQSILREYRSRVGKSWLRKNFLTIGIRDIFEIWDFSFSEFQSPGLAIFWVSGF